MRSLLDVNVLIALLDAQHVSHETAFGWFASHAEEGWASCPITQNGCARVMAHRAYPNPIPVNHIVQRLRQACDSHLHSFWPDDLTLLDRATFDPHRIHGSRQITDLYLLALAVRHGGRLVTFDRTISLEAVKGAHSGHLLTL